MGAGCRWEGRCRRAGKGGGGWGVGVGAKAELSVGWLLAQGKGCPGGRDVQVLCVLTDPCTWPSEVTQILPYPLTLPLLNP